MEEERAARLSAPLQQLIEENSVAFQDRESLKRGFGSQPLYLFRVALDLFSSFPLSPSLSLSLCIHLHFSCSSSSFALFDVL